MVLAIEDLVQFISAEDLDGKPAKQRFESDIKSQLEPETSTAVELLFLSPKHRAAVVSQLATPARNQASIVLDSLLRALPVDVSPARRCRVACSAAATRTRDRWEPLVTCLDAAVALNERNESHLEALDITECLVAIAREAVAQERPRSRQLHGALTVLSFLVSVAHLDQLTLLIEKHWCLLYHRALRR